MDKIRQACRRTHYPAYHKSGTRKLSAISIIVIHDTEGGTAESVAAYFQSPDSGGSAHLVVDDKQCQRCLPNTAIPWGAPGANTQGFHIEQCGFAAWTAEQWMKHTMMLQRGAYKAAAHCHLLKIPPVFVRASGLEAGKRGITTHLECTRAFGGDHTDPGPGWPREYWMTMVQHYLKEF